jgi:ribosome biogenesis GTPase A
LRCTVGKGAAFYKEFQKVVEDADVILQVLDTRDPCSCRCKDIEQYVRQVDPSKRIILILNKVGALAIGAHPFSCSYTGAGLRF